MLMCTRLPRSFSKPSQPSSIHAPSHPPPTSSSQRNTQRSDYRWPSALSPSPTYQSPVLVPSPYVSQTITRTAKRVAHTLFSGTCLSNVPTPLTSPYAYLSASIATRLKVKLVRGCIHYSQAQAQLGYQPELSMQKNNSVAEKVPCSHSDRRYRFLWS